MKRELCVFFSPGSKALKYTSNVMVTTSKTHNPLWGPNISFTLYILSTLMPCVDFYSNVFSTVWPFEPMSFTKVKSNPRFSTDHSGRAAFKPAVQGLCLPLLAVLIIT